MFKSNGHQQLQREGTDFFLFKGGAGRTSVPKEMLCLGVSLYHHPNLNLLLIRNPNTDLSQPQSWCSRKLNSYTEIPHFKNESYDLQGGKVTEKGTLESVQ